jgi:hypothetical protein
MGVQEAGENVRTSDRKVQSGKNRPARGTKQPIPLDDGENHINRLSKGEPQAMTANLDKTFNPALCMTGEAHLPNFLGPAAVLPAPSSMKNDTDSDLLAVKKKID